MHRYFGFPIATLQLFQHPENVKISIFAFTRSQQKYYIFKSIYQIFKNFLLAERWWWWLLWLKISRGQTFSLRNSNVTTFPLCRKCKKFNFSLYTVPAEMIYIEKYLVIFKNFLLPERCGRWLLLLKISSAQKFWFCNSNVRTFPTSRKCKIFNFSLYALPAEILYLQKYSRYNFSNIQKM